MSKRKEKMSWSSQIGRWMPELKLHPMDIYIVAGLYFIVVVTIGLRVHLMGDGQSETDFFGAYVSQAKAFLRGEIPIDPFRGPLYPFALGIFSLPMSLFGLGLFESGIVLSALCAAVVLVLTNRIVRDLFSPVLAIIVSLLLVANPTFFRYSYTTGNDMFFAVLATASLYFVLRKDFEWRWVVLTGLFGALGYLTRYNGVAIVFAACISIILLNVWQLNWKKRLFAAGLLVATVMVVALPWGLYTLAEKGALFYNRNHINVAAGFYAGGEEIDHFLAKHPGEFDNLLEVFLFDPGRFLANIPLNAWDQTRSVMKRVILNRISVLFFIGVMTMFFRPPTRRQAAYYLHGLIFFSVLWLVFYADRFMLFMVPMLATLSVRGAAVLASLATGATARRIIFVIIIVAALIWSLRFSVPYNKYYLPGGSIGYRKMAEDFITKVPPNERGKRVVARKPYFAYFSNLENIPLPVVRTEAELLVYMRGRNADYLLFTKIAARTRPEIVSLFDHRAPHEGLKVIAVSELGVLYEVLDEEGSEGADATGE